VADFDRYEIVEDDEFVIRHTPDILWRNSTTGVNRLVLMDYWRGTYGRRRDQNLFEMPTRFVLGAVGDYNVDGWANLVWRCVSDCEPGEEGFRMWVRLNPRSSAENQDEPWLHYEFIELVGQCEESSGDCVLDSNLQLLGPG
jgi:hypothetical protein